MQMSYAKEHVFVCFTMLEPHKQNSIHLCGILGGGNGNCDEYLKNLCT